MNTGTSIFDQISLCSYPTNSKDYIGSVVLELYTMNKTTKFFKIVKDGDKILVALYRITVNFKGKNYEVPVLIYLPKLFPKVQPEIYLETKSDMGINPKNKDINATTKQMSLGSLRAWGNYSTLKGVIADIEISFRKEFPVFKLSTGVGTNSNTDIFNFKNAEECLIEGTKTIDTNKSNWNQLYSNNNPNSVYTSNTNSIYNNSTSNSIPQVPGSNSNIFDSTYNNNTNNNNNLYNNQPIYFNPNNLDINNVNISQTSYSSYNPINNNNNLNNININNNIYNNRMNNNLNINFKNEIKKKLVEELKRSLEQKIKIEIGIVKSTDETLNKYKRDLLSLKDKYLIFLNSKNLIENDIIKKIDSISREVGEINLSIIASKENIMTQNNYSTFIQVQSLNLIKICSVEATIEDILLVLKKGFEKGVLKFDDSVRIYRDMSKELIKVKFYKEKIQNGLNN
jgi:hypothetical protein